MISLDVIWYVINNMISYLHTYLLLTITHHVLYVFFEIATFFVHAQETIHRSTEGVQLVPQPGVSRPGCALVVLLTIVYEVHDATKNLKILWMVAKSESTVEAYPMILGGFLPSFWWCRISQPSTVYRSISWGYPGIIISVNGCDISLICLSSLYNGDLMGCGIYLLSISWGYPGIYCGWKKSCTSW